MVFLCFLTVLIAETVLPDGGSRRPAFAGRYTQIEDSLQGGFPVWEHDLNPLQLLQMKNKGGDYAGISKTYLYYDRVNAMWILAPYISDEGALELPGFAYAVGDARLGTMPEHFRKGDWRTWLPEGKLNDGVGEWMSNRGVITFGARTSTLEINPQRADTKVCELGHHKVHLPECWPPEMQPKVSLAPTPVPTVNASWNGTLGPTPAPTPNPTPAPTPAPTVDYSDSDVYYPGDTFLPPFETSMTFSFGPLEETGVYRLCYCSPGWDGECTGDKEYGFELGLLVGMVVQGGEFWACQAGRNCTLTVDMFRTSDVDRLLVVPFETLCEDAVGEPAEPGMSPPTHTHPRL